MAYTNKLRLAIISDLIWGAVLIIPLAIIIRNGTDLTPAAIAIAIVVSVISCLTDQYAHKEWGKLWKISSAHLCIYCLVAAVLAVALIKVSGMERYTGCALIFIFLVSGHFIATDTEYYIRAKKYGMDGLSSVTELLEKHPEAKVLINRDKL